MMSSLVLNSSHNRPCFRVVRSVRRQHENFGTERQRQRYFSSLFMLVRPGRRRFSFHQVSSNVVGRINFTCDISEFPDHRLVIAPRSFDVDTRFFSSGNSVSMPLSSVPLSGDATNASLEILSSQSLTRSLASRLSLHAHYAPGSSWNPALILNDLHSYISCLQHITPSHTKYSLLNEHVVRDAIRCTSRTNLPPHKLGPLVRKLEVALQLTHFSMTDALSLSLIRAHADGGNVWRVCEIVRWRRRQNFPVATYDRIKGQGLQHETIQPTPSHVVFRNLPKNYPSIVADDIQVTAYKEEEEKASLPPVRPWWYLPEKTQNFFAADAQNSDIDPILLSIMKTTTTTTMSSPVAAIATGSHCDVSPGPVSEYHAILHALTCNALGLRSSSPSPKWQRSVLEAKLNRLKSALSAVRKDVNETHKAYLEALHTDGGAVAIFGAPQSTFPKSETNWTAEITMRCLDLRKHHGSLPDTLDKIVEKLWSGESLAVANDNLWTKFVRSCSSSDPSPIDDPAVRDFAKLLCLRTPQGAHITQSIPGEEQGFSHYCKLKNLTRSKIFVDDKEIQGKDKSVKRKQRPRFKDEHPRFIRHVYHSLRDSWVQHVHNIIGGAVEALSMSPLPLSSNPQPVADYGAYVSRLKKRYIREEKLISQLETVRSQLRVADPYPWVESVAFGMASAGFWPPPPEQRLIEGMLDAFTAGGRRVGKFSNNKVETVEHMIRIDQVHFDEEKQLWVNKNKEAPEISPSAFNALAFADNLRRGKYGNIPIALNRSCWNILVKICCYDGAIWRALHILRVEMPKQGVEADTYTYNTILSALSRMGYHHACNGILVDMANRSIPLDKYTVEALAMAHLNAGDVAAASTVVQNMFNQYSVLPPYEVHLSIIKKALSPADNGRQQQFGEKTTTRNTAEARRHVHFLRQLEKWEPSTYDSPELKKWVHLTRNNPNLSYKALQELFKAFGEDLELRT
uniref:Pentacotripeptide-repeat region of PRORP domain-containing protein n=1 Tax=Corethron hystrix TaxID=216773 RepID=A0A7S1FXH1_9STRA|mmetsp:Transcript_35319/g.81836  ORF Transcript_35319/g.81836 Transcript_35319/m.81836 type:complete len:966 (+) Transcript_35319:164-3061(+)